MKSTGLLLQRRFGPFFGVQFFGAFNDNVFKNALVLMVTFRAVSEAESGMLTNAAGGLFIFPYILVSAFAGQIADKYEKGNLMRWIKVAEIVIMAIAAAGFFLDSLVLLYVCLFFMGAQSAFFGPVKYSILPQSLEKSELMAGNALVELGTFLAILLGTVTAGLLAGSSLYAVAFGVVFFAIVGWGFSLGIPYTKAGDPDLELHWNPIPESLALLKLCRKDFTIWLCILGISWFWFFGAAVLSQLPNFAKYFLMGNESVVTFLLAIFSLSIGIGSMMCEQLSREEVEIGLVPFGALGLSLFSLDIFLLDFSALASHPELQAGALGIGALLKNEYGIPWMRAAVDIFGLGVSGALFIIPLYALIQDRSDEAIRSRLIAGNNILNAFFIVGAAILPFAFYAMGGSTLGIFLILAIMNAGICLYIFGLIPEFAMRLVVWVLASTIYRLRYENRDAIPRQGGAVLISNHVSYIDWFIVIAACRRPVRFVMYHKFYTIPGLNFLFRGAKAIPIAPEKEDAELKEQAFEEISAGLRQGDLVCIFPEGTLTRDGGLCPFKPGIERILKTDSVPVVPMSLNGLWGSFFSRFEGRAFTSVPRPSRRVITVKVGTPETGVVSAREWESRVGALLL